MVVAEVSTEFDIWLGKLQIRCSDADIQNIKKAYAMASKAHAGQQRVSGEPFITHSLNVAKILFELESDVEVLMAGLLHDVPEDTDVTVIDIHRAFGPTVAALVDGVTKLTEVETFDHKKNPFRIQTRKEYQRAESLRKMFLAMGDDIRVVIIKLADRLHNMRTLSSMPDNKRQRISRETLDIFAPLASRLGIFQIKCELEDLTFKYLHPQEYYDLARQVSQGKPERDRYITQLAVDLEQTLLSAGVKASLQWRAKHLYSIYRKMMRKGVNLDHIFDVTALRVIVDDVTDCYTALGIVHTNWRPVPGEFDDYIAAPKENGYQSLHTAVTDKRGERFEVQIRTKDMDYQAEYGIAAHWRYKDESKPDEALDQKIAAMRQAIKWQQDVVMDANETEDAGDFIDDLKADIIEERVYVFTPKGDIHNLPQGATPIDFAYYIHTEVGHKCRGSKVNGKLVSLDYMLKNGDQVEILTAKRGGPSRDWLNENLGYVKTGRARANIRHWFKRQNYEDSKSQGRLILDREFKRLSIADIKLDDLADVCGYDKIDDFLAAIGFNDISIKQVIRKALEILPPEDETDEAFITITPAPEASEGTDSIQVKGTDNLLNHLANCCQPMPGDPVIGYITRGRGVTVHRRDCANILKVTDRERLIEVNWGADQVKGYAGDIIISAYDRPGLLRDISDVIANDQVNIKNLGVITRSNNTAKILATLEVSSLDHLIKLMDKIEQVPNIFGVTRRGQSRRDGALNGNAVHEGPL